MASWSLEIWLLILVPGVLCVLGLASMLAKAIDDIQRLEKLRVDVHFLRIEFNARMKKLEGRQAAEGGIDMME
jgi:hypothetical protein